MDLCDLFQSVPHLRSAVIKQGSLAQLLGVNRETRSWVHSFASQLRLELYDYDESTNEYKGHYDTLVDNTWPNLQRLSICARFLDVSCAQRLTQGLWPLLQQLSIEVEWWSPACVEHISKMQPYLSKLSLKRTKLTWDPSDLIKLLAAEWPQLQSLTVEGIRIRWISHEFSLWSARHQITELCFSDCSLQATQLEDLCLHEWSSLKRLCLRYNYFSVHYLYMLHKARFHCLEELDLTGCGWRYVHSVLGPSDHRQEHMFWGHRHTMGSSDTFPVLKILRMPAAEEAVVACMLAIDYSVLEQYDFKRSAFSSKIMQQLIACPSCRLTVLNLSSSSLSVWYVQDLVNGIWPNLRSLDVSRNQLCADALSHLIACKTWPLLRQLNFANNALKGLEEVDVGNGFTLQVTVLQTSAGTMPAWLQEHWPDVECVDLSWS